MYSIRILLISLSFILFIGCKVSNILEPQHIEPNPIVEYGISILDSKTQVCKIEWVGEVTYTDKLELVEDIERLLENSECQASNLLCITSIFPGCEKTYIFQTFNDIPVQSVKGKCEKYLIRYAH